MAEKILVVDDNLETLKLIGVMLEQQGYEISAADNGTQALEKVAEDRPDLIILDVMMPDMDGYEVARRIRSDPLTMSIPIIMFTAKGTVSDKVAGFEAGADDFLTKPTHPAELASRVRALLSRTAKRPSAGPGEPGQIVSFIGVKGGVGTTTLALNTAVAISQLVEGSKVALAEMRLGQGSIGLMLGYAHPGSLSNLVSRGLAGLTTRAIEGELAHHSSGLHLLMASPVPEQEKVDFTPEMAEIMVRKLAALVDYLLLDLGSGLSPENRRLVTISKQVIICLEPQRVAVELAQQMLQELHELGLGTRRTDIALISRTPSGLQTSWQSVQQTLQKEVLAKISPSPELAYQAIEQQVPMIQLQPDSIPAGQFRELGKELVARIGSVAEQAG